MNNSPDYIASQRFVTVGNEFAGWRLDQVVASLLPMHSRQRIQRWIKEGLILLDDRPADKKQKVSGGERMTLNVPEVKEQVHQEAQDIPLEIVHEDEQILIVNKPVGLVVHPGSGNPDGTLLNALLHHAPTLVNVPRAGIVHRIDKDTSGLLVVAKSLVAQTELIRQLQSHSVNRHYIALVHGRLAQDGVVDAPIGRHPTQRTRMAVVGGGKEAITHYTIERRYAAATLVHCQLETGRTHQIRVHMAHLGHALVGDQVYCRRPGRNVLLANFPRQALHAFKLELRHPQSGQMLSFTSELAEDLQNLLKQLDDDL